MIRRRSCPLIWVPSLAWTLLIATVWAISIRWYVYYRANGAAIGIGRGSIVWTSIDSFSEPPPAWHVVARREAEAGPWGRSSLIPWLILGVVGIAAGHCCFCRRRAGHCDRCGYDLSGAPSGICPECGPTAAQQKAKEAGSSST
jgi:hypothetical protein